MTILKYQDTSGSSAALRADRGGSEREADIHADRSARVIAVVVVVVVTVEPVAVTGAVDAVHENRPGRGDPPPGVARERTDRRHRRTQPVTVMRRMRYTGTAVSVRRTVRGRTRRRRTGVANGSPTGMCRGAGRLRRVMRSPCVRRTRGSPAESSVSARRGNSRSRREEQCENSNDLVHGVILSQLVLTRGKADQTRFSDTISSPSPIVFRET